MRHWLLIPGLLCCTQTSAADELRGEILVTSNYVWRGITLSDDAPSVIGGLDYRHPKGWFGSAQVATVRVDDNPEQQALLTGGIAKPKGDWLFDLGVVVYEYTRGDIYVPENDRLEPGTSNKNDFIEWFVGVAYGNGNLRHYRSEDYLGEGRLSNYYDLNYTAPLPNDARLVLHLGYTVSSAINDHSDDVGDTALGIAKGPFSFLITNMDDNEDGLQSRNPRFVISWYQSIAL